MKAALKDVVLALPASNAAKLDSASLALLEKAITGGPVSMTGTLNSIMEQLDNSFNSSLNELMADKKKADADHENATAEVRATLTSLKKQTAMLQRKVAEIETEIAEKTELKGATEAQKKADADFLSTTSKTCLSRRKEFNNFVKQREQELAGCNKALEHLTSDKA
jgi:chromosome segregation ATPase